MKETGVTKQYIVSLELKESCDVRSIPCEFSVVALLAERRNFTVSHVSCFKAAKTHRLRLNTTTSQIENDVEPVTQCFKISCGLVFNWKTM